MKLNHKKTASPSPKFICFVLVAVFVAQILCGCVQTPPYDKPITVNTKNDGSDTIVIQPGTDDGTGTDVSQTDAETDAGTEVETAPPVGPDDVVCGNDDLVYNYTDEMYAALNDKIAQVWVLIEENNPDKTQEFIDLYNDIDDNDFCIILDQYMLANMLNMLYAYDPAYSDQLVTISEKFNQARKDLIVMYDDIYESVYSEKFYEDWTETEIERAVKLAKTYTDELVQLRVERDAIQSEYYAIADDDKYMTNTAEIYIRAIENNKKIAAAAGYSDYMTYAYENEYSRDYFPEDTAKMEEYVKQYIVPMLSPLLDSLTANAQSLTSADVVDFNLYFESSLPTMGVVPSFGKGIPKLSKNISTYLSSISEDFLTEYENLWANNHYIIARNAKVSRQGACSGYFHNLGYPVCYFGPDYQTVYTVLHEYGHYYAMNLSETGDMPIDLAEVHSQGNEWLFTAYLKNLMADKSYDFLEEYRLFSDLCTICNCMCVNKFEMYVYSHEGYTAADLDGIMENVMKEMGVYDVLCEAYANPVQYWHYVTVDNPAYYISYAISLVPSIELFAMAQDDFSVATASYLAIAKVDPEKDTFLGMLSKASISSPFESNAYILISKLAQ